MESSEEPAVTRFREYLRFKSVHPDPDYADCIIWLRNQAKEIGLLFNLVEFPKPAEFTIIMTWKGRDSTLKSISLNSHIDVVPVDASRWVHEPFGAEKDADGNIYARGSQDMKCVGVQYLEAIRNLKRKGFVPLRDIHVTFVPDEEVGTKGMITFVRTPEFQRLNIGLAFDEGIASPNDSYEFYYGERSIWQILVTATGKPGDCDHMSDGTAAEKLNKFIGRMMDLRNEQKKLMEELDLDLGDVTTFNLTGISGGKSPDKIPTELTATFDIRVSPTIHLSEIKSLLDGICKHNGPGLSYVNLSYADSSAMTLLNAENPWWISFKAVAAKLKIKINPKIFPAYTDGSIMRSFGIPTFGFSPMNNTPILLHDNDECLNEKIFLRGIEIYEAILEKVSCIPREVTP